jgi:hypothetical protein
VSLQKVGLAQFWVTCNQTSSTNFLEKIFIYEKSIFLSVAILLASVAFSQSKSANSSTYKNALGVKLWDGGGITYKHFFDGQNAGELVGFLGRQGVRITGLYEIHKPINSVEGLQWYIGPGAHVGFYNTKFGGGSFIGIDGVLGLDYKLNDAPINLSLDWQPSFEFGTNRGFVGSWGGLGVRYTF